MKNFFLLLCLSFSLFAHDQKCNQVTFPKCPPQCNLEKCIQLEKTSHYYTSFQLLILEAKQKGLEYALNNSSTGISIDAKVKNMPFSYQWGGKATFGYLFEQDLWDIRADGSCFFSSSNDTSYQQVVNASSATAAFNGKGIIPVWNSISEGNMYTYARNRVRYSTAEAHWSLDFYNAEAELGKIFQVGKKVSLRPSFGLKSIFTYQSFKIDYLSGNTYYPNNTATVSVENISDKVLLKNIAEGIGPKVAIETKWFIHENVKILVNAVGALFYTFFKTSISENPFLVYTDSAAPATAYYNTTYKTKSVFQSYKPYAGLTLGIGWEKCFERKTHSPLKITVDTAYSIENFWKLNQMIKYCSSVNTGSFFQNGRDLEMQGVTIALSCLF